MVHEHALCKVSMMRSDYAHSQCSQKRSQLQVPTVPKQENSHDCGLFVMTYLDFFVGGLPQSVVKDDQCDSGVRCKFPTPARYVYMSADGMCMFHKIPASLCIPSQDPYQAQILSVAVIGTSFSMYCAHAGNRRVTAVSWNEIGSRSRILNPSAYNSRRISCS